MCHICSPHRRGVGGSGSARLALVGRGGGAGARMSQTRCAKAARTGGARRLRAEASRAGGAGGAPGPGSQSADDVCACAAHSARARRVGPSVPPTPVSLAFARRQVCRSPKRGPTAPGGAPQPRAAGDDCPVPLQLGDGAWGGAENRDRQDVCVCLSVMHAIASHICAPLLARLCGLATWSASRWPTRGMSRPSIGRSFPGPCMQGVVSVRGRMHACCDACATVLRSGHFGDLCGCLRSVENCC